MPKNSKNDAYKKMFLGKLRAIPEVAKNAFVEYAEAVAVSAGEMSPRDTGEMEKSFIVKVSNESSDTKIVVDVFIDPSSIAADYADIVDSKLPPASQEWKLGRESVKKQDDNPDVLIGGMVLERALIENELDLLTPIKEALK